MSDLSMAPRTPTSPATAPFDSQAPADDSAAANLESAAAPLTEDLALALLKRKDLTAESIDEIAKNAVSLNSRKVRLGVIAHAHTPRRVTLKLLRQLHTFDLMQAALMPHLSGDLKRVADELLVSRLASITIGERISLARRASETIAMALLLDKETRVLHAALENSRLTEAGVVKALARSAAPAHFVQAVCRHSKWSLRREVRMALLRNPRTPLAAALEFARTLPAAQVRDILHSSQLSEKVKTCLRKELDARR
jgi:hypothetical protein